MKRVMEKEVKMLDALIRLKIPIMVTKFDSHGNPGKRLLKLSPDGTDIMWKKQAAAIWSSSKQNLFIPGAYCSSAFSKCDCNHFWTKN
jgi:hypothetical protein